MTVSCFSTDCPDPATAEVVPRSTFAGTIPACPAHLQDAKAQARLVGGNPVKIRALGVPTAPAAAGRDMGTMFPALVPPGLPARTVTVKGHTRRVRARPLDPDQTGGKTGRDHPDTAKQAGFTVKVGSQKAAVLHCLTLGDRTAAELAPLVTHELGRTAANPVSRNQVAARLLELREDGLVEHAHDETGAVLVRATGGGHAGQVHGLTRAGRIEAVRFQGYGQ